MRPQSHSHQRNLRVSGAIRAAYVAAAGAGLAPTGEHCVALVAVPAHTLAGLLVDQVLATGLRRLCQLEVGLLINTPIGHNGRVRGELLGLGRAALTAGLLLLLGTLGRVASALLASGVRTVRTLLGHTEGSVAQMAVAPDAHANRLLGAESSTLGRPPLAGIDLEAEALAELLSALLIDLAPGDPGDALGDLGFDLGLLTSTRLALRDIDGRLRA